MSMDFGMAAHAHGARTELVLEIDVANFLHALRQHLRGAADGVQIHAAVFLASRKRLT
jgi:hypothetical protein